MSYLPQRIFVYGTLQPGGTYWRQFCEAKVKNVRAAKVRGQLFDLHQGYPGARFGGETWIQGCVLSVLSEQAFKNIDELEGYDPSRGHSENEYTRVRIQYYDMDEIAQGQVWSYEINRHALRRYQGSLIPGGIWPL